MLQLHAGGGGDGRPAGAAATTAMEDPIYSSSETGRPRGRSPTRHGRRPPPVLRHVNDVTCGQATTRFDCVAFRGEEAAQAKGRVASLHGIHPSGGIGSPACGPRHGWSPRGSRVRSETQARVVQYYIYIFILF